MSDPVTNAEVEDVLSSIRRLVSEDKRPVQAVKAEPRNDRLVLTPALRVSDDVVKDGDPALTGATTSPRSLFEDEPTGDSEKSNISIGSLVTDDALVDVYDDETVQSLDAPEQTIDEASLEAEQEELDEEDDLRFDDPAHDYSSDPYNFDDDDDDDGEGNAASFSSQSVDGSAEEDSVETSIQEMSQTEVLIPREDSSDEEVTDGQDDENSATAQTTAASEASAAALTAKIAALETAIGQISETWEPDDAGESDYAGSEMQAMEWEDDPREQELKPQAESIFPRPSQAPEKTEPEAEPLSSQHTGSHDDEAAEVAGEPTDGGFDYTDEEQLIDEDALRDLVSDIVRAELQGALGERITRNVRKLVRREIHRALTAQDLE
jgi:hypothetical protein